MVKTTGVRGPTLAQFDTALVLLFEGRTSCFTSYGNRAVNRQPGFRTEDS